MKVCKWCDAEEGYCDCEERRNCKKAGQSGHKMCGTLKCGCPAFFGSCTGRCGNSEVEIIKRCNPCVTYTRKNGEVRHHVCMSMGEKRRMILRMNKPWLS